MSDRTDGHGFADDLSSTVPFTESAEQNLSFQVGTPWEQQMVCWTVQYQLSRRLGQGGQGVVYLADRIGADGMRVPVALKFFSTARYANAAAYGADMCRVARIAARVALIQHDHLLDVHNFVDLQGIRVMAMEWVDGFDLSFLLAHETLSHMRDRLRPERWKYLNDVVITNGATHARLKPGVAVAIIRECLAALAALHRGQIIHGDIKPSNLMLKCTGNTKIIDLGSACASDDALTQRPFSPQYAAPEVLQGEPCTPASDLASLGYVLVEMLAGHGPFAGIDDLTDLAKAKLSFRNKLPGLLPHDVLASESLMHLILILVEPNPAKRCASAEAADLMELGAASFQRELVTSNLASEYETEIRLWLRDCTQCWECS